MGGDPGARVVTGAPEHVSVVSGQSGSPADALDAALARPPIDPAHDALHAIERGTVQGLLAMTGGLKLWA
jgi:hypothetical protein